MTDCKTCGGDEVISLGERIVDCDCGGRDGGDCVMCKGRGYYTIMQMIECFVCSQLLPDEARRP